MIHEDDKYNLQEYAKVRYGLNLTDLQAEAVFNIVMFTPGGDLDVLLAFLKDESLKKFVQNSADEL